MDLVLLLKIADENVMGSGLERETMALEVATQIEAGEAEGGRRGRKTEDAKGGEIDKSLFLILLPRLAS